jgi:phosphoglycolate phosphatase
LSVHPALRGVRAVLFDKDGTLLDFDATWAPSLAEAMEALSDGDAALAVSLAEGCGLDVAAMRFRADSPFLGGYTDDFAPRWAERLGVAYDAGFVARLDASFRAASLRHMTAFADVGPAVRRFVAAGLRVGLATNDFTETGRLHLERMGVLAAFGFVAGYDAGFGAKPGGGMVAAFAASAGVPAAAVALVGDSPHDMAAAASVGAVPVGIAREARAAAILAASPVAPALTVADLGHLVEALGLGQLS